MKKQGKNIYLEITPFFPSDIHFVGPYIYDQVKSIERRGDFEVVVVKVVSIFDNTPAEYVYQGVRVFNFKVFDLPSSTLPGLFHKINLIRLKKFLKEVVKIDFEQIAFIHAHVAYPAGALAADLGREHNIKNFVQHHGLDVMQLRNGRILGGKLKEWNGKFIKRRFLKTTNGTNLNIGVSQKVVDELKKIEGFCNQNTYVLYNGVDTSKFYRIENRKKSDFFTIGCIGNFWKIKDQMTLLKALNLLLKGRCIDNIKVVFVGSGPTLGSCLSYVEENGLGKYVEFKKEIDHTQLNTFYNSLDLFVLPSYYEALGCVYTEALQVGVPIIAVENQGIEELLHKEEKAFSLIPKHDEKRLADLICWHLEKKHSLTPYDLNIDNFISEFLSKVTDA
ncbi:glycosyltransferase [Hydrogenimonas cancrithermarum]|nr:glycosyltransferase [Hydrogenimonas cancrithermarum]